MGKYWMYRMFGYGSDEPDTYCDYVRKAKEKLATEVVPRNFRVEISEGQFRQASGVSYYQYQYAQKQLFYEGYGHTIPTFSYGVDYGGEAYYTSPLPSGDPMNDRATCPKDPTLGMFYDLCLELDVLRSQIEESDKELELLRSQIEEMDELRHVLRSQIEEMDELRAELVELKKAKDIQSEVDELRAELVELKKAKDIQSEVDELRAELAELKPKQQPKGKFGFFHKQS